MYYYYSVETGELIESTRMLKSGVIPMSSLQFSIAHLMIDGYSKQEIKDAVEYVYLLMRNRVES